MIKYNGIRFKDKFPYLVLENEMQQEVEIPIDKATANRIPKYLFKIALFGEMGVERGNDEEGEVREE